MRHRGLGSPLALLVLLAACSPSPAQPIGAVAGLGGGDAGPPVPGLDPSPLAFAVVSSDYVVSSVGLLSPQGQVLSGEFIGSGSAPPGLVTALSGDVSLPTRSGDPRVLTLLDRFRTDVVTRVDPQAGTVLGQVATSAGDGSYSANPQDYVTIDDRSAWVSRFEPNPDVAEDDRDRGTDLIEIDPQRFERTGRRISLEHFNTEAERVNPDTGERQMVVAYARPTRMLRLGDQLAVGLGGLSRSFDAVGPGQVALVDPQTGDSQVLRLPGLASCVDLSPVPDDERRVAVACTGFYRGAQRESGGLAMLELVDGELRVEHLWRAAEHPEQALSVYALVALNGTQVLAVAAGKGESDQDVLLQVDLSRATQHTVFEARGRFVLGNGAYNPRTGLLMLPDASLDEAGNPAAGVHLFEWNAEGKLVLRDTLRVSSKLPPRHVAPL